MVNKILVALVPVAVAYLCLCREKFDAESIRGKRVLVTGASSGIGEKVAYRYAQLGAKLVITARRAELLEKVAKKCQELGAESVRSIAADMGSKTDRTLVAETAVKVMGGLDILILNHAIMGYSLWRSTNEDLATLEQMTNVNFISFVDLTSQLMKSLEESKGSIGVVSSVAGKMGSIGMGPYVSSKHALQGFYASLRQELRYRKTGVSVTLIVYGPVDSDKALEIVKDMPATIEFSTVAGTTDDAADVLVRGVAARKYEVFFPILSTVMSYLIRLCPHFAEDLGTKFMPEGDFKI